MQLLRSTFDKLVIPVRALGVVAMAFGFGRILAATDPDGIWLAAAGSLIWQAGTLLKKQSPLFRRLQSTPVDSVMRSRRIAVPSWWTVGKVRAEFPSAADRTFFVSMQNQRPSGIVLPETVHSVSNDDARYATMAHLEEPISSLNSVHLQDTMLDAVSLMERLARPYIQVTDSSDTLVGVVTRDQIVGFLAGGSDSEIVDKAQALQDSSTDSDRRLAA